MIIPMPNVEIDFKLEAVEDNANANEAVEDKSQDQQG
jgi:hypothetical protein